VHKRLSWLAAGIRIMSTGGLSTGFEARSCMACNPAPCAEAYKKAVGHLGIGANDFYRLLGMGTSKAAEHYGGSDYACVLGQEMAGYATGEVFYTAQSLGFRHSQPEKVTIPKRFTELTTWKGNTDINYLNALKSAYAEKINEMGVSKDRDE
jgi:hypothetical protein